MINMRQAVQLLSAKKHKGWWWASSGWASFPRTEGLDGFH